MNSGLWLKKQKKVESGSPNWTEEGDAWIYTCIKRNTYFFIAFAIGRCTQDTCRKMIEQLYNRIQLPFPYDKLEIYFDGNDDYIYVLSEYYADTCINCHFLKGF